MEICANNSGSSANLKMTQLGSTKVEKLTPKPKHTYPFIRLPKEMAHAIGLKVNIFKTVVNEQESYVIVPDYPSHGGGLEFES